MATTEKRVRRKKQAANRAARAATGTAPQRVDITATLTEILEDSVPSCCAQAARLLHGELSNRQTKTAVVHEDFDAEGDMEHDLRVVVVLELKPKGQRFSKTSVGTLRLPRL